MLESLYQGFYRLFAARPPWQVLRDLADIVIVAWVIYRALLVLRGTRAIQMAVGLGIVLLVYVGAKLLHFITLLNLLSWLLSSIVLIVVVIFQNDIRRALIRMGGTAWFTGGREQQSRVIDEVVAAATELARHRMGALIAFEQDANVLEFVKSDGIPLDSVVTRELLVSLFVPESVNKLHDGAVLIRDLKIARAGIFFPMPDTKILDAQLGSRHRAALGITEETDAVVVVVSEERGTISFCFSGNIVSNLDGQSLRHALLGLFGRSARKKAPAKKAVTPVATPARAASSDSGSFPKQSLSTKIPTSPLGRANSASLPPSSSMKTPLGQEVTKRISLSTPFAAPSIDPPTGPISVSAKSSSTPMRSSTDAPAPTSVGSPQSVRRPTFIPAIAPTSKRLGNDDDGPPGGQDSAPPSDDS
ncbi:MAG: diadenylate cyclase CdaA [Byssovorax sp.]